MKTLLSFSLFLLIAPNVFAGEAALDRVPMDKWMPFLQEGQWETEANGSVICAGTADAGRLAPLTSTENGVVEVRFRTEGEGTGRENVGMVFRADKQGNALVVRYYDQINALQVLSYENAKSSGAVAFSSSIPFERNKWYRMKGAMVNNTLLAKMWQEDAAEPNWQIVLDTADPKPVPDDDREVQPHAWVSTANQKPLGPNRGRFGVICYDETAVRFDEIRVVSVGPGIEALQQQLDEVLRQEWEQVKDKLQLCLSLAPFSEETEENLVRRLHVSTVANGTRTPVKLTGKLTLEFGEHHETQQVAIQDWDDGLLTLTIPNPTVATDLKLTLDSDLDGFSLSATTSVETDEWLSWGEYVRRCLDTLVEHGRDTYGDVHTPVMMSIIDVKTRAAPHVPGLYDGYVRTEGRRHRRAEGGANLWNDQATLRSMYHLSEKLNDPKYAQAADDYIAFILAYCHNNNGLLQWGSHCFYDAHTDRVGGDTRGGGVHEILIRQAEWHQLYRVNPRGMERQAELIWTHHIQDKTTGMHNRHDSEGTGDFAFSGGSFAMVFSFMYHATQDEKWLRRAQLIADWHWGARNPDTGLAPTSPASPYPQNFNGRHASTQLVGPFAAQLLRCFELTGDTRFRHYAVTFIKAYDKYGWDEEHQTYWGAIRLDRSAFASARLQRVMEHESEPEVFAIDGTPLRDKADFYDYIWAPDGHVDVWKTIIYSWEFPVEAAQASIDAYNLSGKDPASRDPELLAIARRWAHVIESNMPPTPGRRFREAMEATLPDVTETGGTYAENYGRAISFFVHLYRATQEQHYLNLAETLARESVEKLYENGLFRGHPAKPYYDALDGVGLLLWALLDLDDPEQALQAAY